MKLKSIISIMSVLFSFLASSASAAVEKIMVSYSSRTYAFLPAQVAVAKGFFKDENLDPVLIQMRSQVTVPALMSGEVNYTLSFGNIIAGVKTDKIIPLSQVRDISLLREVQKELRL